MFSRSSTGSRFSALTAKTVVPMNIGTKLTARYGDLNRVFGEILKFQNPRAISYYANFVVPKMVEAIQKLVQATSVDRMVRLINTNQEIDPALVEQLVKLCDNAIEIMTKMKDGSIGDIVDEAWKKLETVLPIEYKDTLVMDPTAISPQFSHYLGLAIEALIGIKGVVTGAKTDSVSISSSASELTGTAGGANRPADGNFEIIPDLKIDIIVDKKLGERLKLLENIAHGAEMVHAARASSTKTAKSIAEQAMNVEQMIKNSRARASLAYDEAVDALQRLTSADGYASAPTDELLSECYRASRSKAFEANIDDMLVLLTEMNEAVEEIRLKMTFGGIKSMEMVHFVAITTGLAARGTLDFVNNKEKYSSIKAITDDLIERMLSEKTFGTALRAWGDASGHAKVTKKFYVITDDDRVVFKAADIAFVYSNYMAYKIALQCVEFNAFGSDDRCMTARFNHITNLIHSVVNHVSALANSAEPRPNQFCRMLVNGLFGMDVDDTGPIKIVTTADAFNKFWANFVAACADKSLTPDVDRATMLQKKLVDMYKRSAPAPSSFAYPMVPGVARDSPDYLNEYMNTVVPYEFIDPVPGRSANLIAAIKMAHTHPGPGNQVGADNLKFEQMAFELRVALESRKDPLLVVFRSLMNNLYYLIEKTANAPIVNREDVTRVIFGGAADRIEKDSMYPAAVAMLTTFSYAGFIDKTESSKTIDVLFEYFKAASARNSADNTFFGEFRMLAINTVASTVFGKIIPAWTTANAPNANAVATACFGAGTARTPGAVIPTFSTPFVAATADLSTNDLVNTMAGSICDKMATDAGQASGNQQLAVNLFDGPAGTYFATRRAAVHATITALRTMLLAKFGSLPGADFYKAAVDKATARDNATPASILAEIKAVIAEVRRPFFELDGMTGPLSNLFMIARRIMANKENFENIDAATFGTCAAALNAVVKENGDDAMMVAAKIRAFAFNHLFVRGKSTKFVDSGMDDMRLIAHFTTNGFGKIIEYASSKKLGEINTVLAKKCEEFASVAEYGADDAFKKVVGYMLKRIDDANDNEKKDLAKSFDDTYADLNRFVDEADRMLITGVPSNFGGDLQSQDTVCGAVARSVVVAMQDGVKLRHNVEPWRRIKIDEVLRMMQDYAANVHDPILASREFDPFGTKAAENVLTQNVDKKQFSAAMVNYKKLVGKHGGLMAIKARLRASPQIVVTPEVKGAYYVVSLFANFIRAATIALGGAAANSIEQRALFNLAAEISAAVVAMAAPNGAGNPTQVAAAVDAAIAANQLTHRQVELDTINTTLPDVQTILDNAAKGQTVWIRERHRTASAEMSTSIVTLIAGYLALPNEYIALADADVAAQTVLDDTGTVSVRMTRDAILTVDRRMSIVLAVVKAAIESRGAIAKIQTFMMKHGAAVSTVDHDTREIQLKRISEKKDIAYYLAESNNSLQDYAAAAERTDVVSDTVHMFNARSLTRGTKAHYDYQLINREPRTFEEFMAAIANFSSLMIGFGYSAQSIVPFAFYHELREADSHIVSDVAPYDAEDQDADFMQRVYSIACKTIILDKMFRHCITPVELMAYSQTMDVAKSIYAWFVDEISVLDTTTQIVSPNWTTTPHITAYRHLFDPAPAAEFVCDMHGNQAMQLLATVETVALGPFAQHFATKMGESNMYRQVRAVKYHSGFDDRRLLPLMGVCMNVDPGFARFDGEKGSYVQNINFAIERLMQPIMRARGVYATMFADTSMDRPTVPFLKTDDVNRQVDILRPENIASYMMADTVSYETKYGFELFDETPSRDKTKIMIRSTIEAVNRLMNNASGATPFAIWNSGATYTPYQLLSLCSAAFVMSNVVSGKLPQDFIAIMREKLLNTFNFGSRQYSFKQGSNDQMVQIPDGAICHMLDQSISEDMQVNEADIPVCVGVNGELLGTSRIAIDRTARHAFDAATLLLVRSVDKAHGLSADDIAASSQHVNKILANSAVFYTFFNKIYNVLSFMRSDIDSAASSAEHGRALEMARTFATICEDMYVRFKDKNTFRTIAGEHGMSKLRGKDRKPLAEVTKFRLGDYQKFIRTVYQNRMRDSADLWGLVPVDQIFTKARCTPETISAVFPAMSGLLGDQFEFSDMANDLSDLWLANYAAASMKWLTISPIGHSDVFDSQLLKLQNVREKMFDAPKHWIHGISGSTDLTTRIATWSGPRTRTDICSFGLRVPASSATGTQHTYGGRTDVADSELAVLVAGVMRAVVSAGGVDTIRQLEVYRTLKAWYSYIRNDAQGSEDDSGFGALVRKIRTVGEQNEFLDTIWRIFVSIVPTLGSPFREYLAANGPAWARRWDVMTTARMSTVEATTGDISMRDAIEFVHANPGLISRMCLLAGTAVHADNDAATDARVLAGLNAIMEPKSAIGTMRAFKTINDGVASSVREPAGLIATFTRPILNIMHDPSPTRVGSALNDAADPNVRNVNPIDRANAITLGLARPNAADANTVDGFVNPGRFDVPVTTEPINSPFYDLLCIPAVSNAVRLTLVDATTAAHGAIGAGIVQMETAANATLSAAVGANTSLRFRIDNTGHPLIEPMTLAESFCLHVILRVSTIIAGIVHASVPPAANAVETAIGNIYADYFQGMRLRARVARYDPYRLKADLSGATVALRYDPFIGVPRKYSAKVIAVAATMLNTISFADAYILIGLGVIDAPNDINDLGGHTSDAILSFKTNVAEATKTKYYDGYLSPLNVFDQATVICPYASAVLYKNWNYGIQEHFIPMLVAFAPNAYAGATVSKPIKNDPVFDQRDITKDTQSWMVAGAESDPANKYLVGFRIMTGMGLKAFDSRDLGAQAQFIHVSRTSMLEADGIVAALTDPDKRISPMSSATTVLPNSFFAGAFPYGYDKMHKAVTYFRVAENATN